MERPALSQSRISNLGFKVGLLLALIPFVAVGLVVYALHARGVFEASQQLILIARDADGVAEGMPVMFSGFPIGRVEGMALTERGEVRIELSIREKDARWLRSGSVFTLEKQLFGGARLRISTPDMNAPQLPPGAQGKLVSVDATQDLPQVIARASAILESVDALIRPGSSLHQSLAHLKEVTGRMAGEHGVIGALTGNADDAARVMQTVEGVNALIASLRSVTSRADSVLDKADARVFGQGGVMEEAQRSIGHLNAMLVDARDSLKKADQVLVQAQTMISEAGAAAGNVKVATTDLAALRAEVDESIRKVSVLIDEINRKWPFARKTEVKLP